MALGVGIVGAGGMGRHHARTVAAHPDARVVAVADVDEAAARTTAHEVDAVWLDDGHDLIVAPEVDAVVIASPDETHRAYAAAALEAGKAVLCEKPLGDSAAAALATLRQETAMGRRLLQLGLMRVYDPAHLELAARVDALGAPERIRAVHHNRNPASRTVDHALSQSLVHDIHTVRWLTGLEFTSVDASASTRPDGGILRAVVEGTLEGGVPVTLEFDDFAAGYDVRVDVNGADGAASLRTVDGASSEDWFDRFLDAYAAEIAAWVPAAATRTATGPSCWDGYAAQVAVDACRRSVRTGEPEPVVLGDRPPLYG